MTSPRNLIVLPALTVLLGLSFVAMPPAASATEANASPLTGIAMNAVSVAPGSTTAWATGNLTDASANGKILRRSGGTWHVVSYTAPAGQVELHDVATGSPHAAWVVGSVQTTVGTPILLHSTGGSFTPVSLPGPKSNVNLIGVAASSASNAWVIGNDDGHGIVPLAYHLVGKRWKTVKLPHLPANYQLESVTTSGPKNTWIVAPGPLNGEVAVLHFNGKKWSKTMLTAVPKLADATAISTSGPKNTWVVGFTQTTPLKPFAAHFNGKKWSKVSMPSAAGELLDVAAVGSKAFAAGNGSSGPVALSFNAGKWRAEKTDKRGTDAQLHAVGASSKLQVVVGSDLSGGDFVPLIDVRSGKHWKRAAA